VAKSDDERLSGVKVRVREEVKAGLKLRRRLTNRKPVGGIALMFAFFVAVLAVGLVIAVPDLRSLAAALALVLVIAVMVHVLDLQYRREVDARIQSAREQFRQTQLARSLSGGPPSVMIRKI
jgi:hypothetical protein